MELTSTPPVQLGEKDSFTQHSIAYLDNTVLCAYFFRSNFLSRIIMVKIYTHTFHTKGLYSRRRMRKHRALQSNLVDNLTDRVTG